MRWDGLQLRRVREELIERGPETFNSTARVVLKADELTLATVSEFVAMLRLVLKKSGLTAGQVAVKTSIARSSAYSLVAVTRTGLPVNPDQVRIFLSGCGLRLDQVDQVMRAWDRLKVDHRGRRAGSGLKCGQVPRQEELGVDDCMKHIRRSRATGDLVGAAAWSRRLTGALLTEQAEHDS